MKTLSDSEFSSLLKSRCIGLTGGVATGKSTIATIIKDMGHAVIDADQLARDVVLPGQPAHDSIIKRFGPSILNPDRSLNRDKLRTIVMSDPGERKALESITHPAIHKKFKEVVESTGIASGTAPFFYEAALLFEAGRDGLFKEVWATSCPEGLQIKRLTARSGISDAEAQKIVLSQMPAALKAQKASRVIATDCSVAELKEIVTNLVQDIR